jgi:hypothetical protein
MRMDAVYPVGPDGFLQGLIRLNYSLINYIKTILSFIMKGYREIITVVIFEFFQTILSNDTLYFVFSNRMKW